MTKSELAALQAKVEALSPKVTVTQPTLPGVEPQAAAPTEPTHIATKLAKKYDSTANWFAAWGPAWKLGRLSNQ